MSEATAERIGNTAQASWREGDGAEAAAGGDGIVAAGGGEDGTEAAAAALGERGDRLIAAGMELLEERGLDGLTVRAVLDRSGLARRAFYDRFAGKDDLLLALFNAHLQGAAAHFAGSCARIDDPLECLRLIVLSIVEGRRESGERSTAMSREHLRLAEARPDELQAAIRPLLALMERQLEAGMARGTVRRAPSARLAMLMYNVMATTVHTELLTPRARDKNGRSADGELAEDIWEFCRRAIAA